MKMNDSGEMDDKVIAVPVEDPRFNHIKDLGDIPSQIQAEINEFFSTYKNLEKDKIVKTLGWEDRDSAIKAIDRGMELYLEKFS